MLAGDASEVSDQAEQFLKTNSLLNYYDEVVLQALLMAQADLRRGVLDELRQKRIKETIDEVIEVLFCRIMSISRLQRHQRRSPLFWRTQGVVLCQLLHAVFPQVLRQSSRRRCQTCRAPSGRVKCWFSPALPAAVFSMNRPRRYLCRFFEEHGMGAKVGAAGALTADRILAPFGRGCAARVPVLL